MNLIQLRISFANAWRSWNSSGKTFPRFARLLWVTPAGLTHRERPGNKALSSTSNPAAEFREATQNQALHQHKKRTPQFHKSRSALNWRFPKQKDKTAENFAY